MLVERVIGHVTLVTIGSTLVVVIVWHVALVEGMVWHLVLVIDHAEGVERHLVLVVEWHLAFFTGAGS